MYTVNQVIQTPEDIFCEKCISKDASENLSLRTDTLSLFSWFSGSFVWMSVLYGERQGRITNVWLSLYLRLKWQCPDLFTTVLKPDNPVMPTQHLTQNESRSCLWVCSFLWPLTKGIHPFICMATHLAQTRKEALDCTFLQLPHCGCSPGSLTLTSLSVFIWMRVGKASTRRSG